ncbi:MAG: hypothetical protein BJ554DRAFT_4984 [Olpidium bornovanus]|uniref:Non-specific serine/threonine protein kinase n=1 Tax=Olpidium bornovanus TaxID=278681 RepID=A0A8H7ZKD4_9FUNG|nr:MAG: hypothetical protein BJ554DRAFT_4984 [Olpidium bornovanus]
MESLCYVLLYFLRGSLPWQGLSAPNKKQKYALILEKKLKTTTEVLCRGFPVEFCMFLNYCRQLRFDETPDYHYLRTLFRDATQRLGYPVEHRFDWELGFTAGDVPGDQQRTLRGLLQSTGGRAPPATAERRAPARRNVRRDPFAPGSRAANRRQCRSSM